MNNRDDPDPSPEEHPEDFDEDADNLWTLYGKEAKRHDETWTEILKGDMDGILIFVCAMRFHVCQD